MTGVFLYSLFLVLSFSSPVSLLLSSPHALISTACLLYNTSVNVNIPGSPGPQTVKKEFAMFDLVIKNARIYDGMGGPFFYASVGIRDGKITAVTRLPLEGARVIDASGLALCPGFIDPHGHADSQLDKEPSQWAKVEQGITTSLGGLCGDSQAPAQLSDGRLLTFSAYLDRLSRLKLGASIGMYLGGGALRAAAMGFSAEKPTAEQMTLMKDLLRDAMEAGAVGLSFGLAYPPSSYFDTPDMIELCKVLAEYDGVAAFHLRNEGDRFTEAIDEAVTVARTSGCRIILSHHKAVREPNWGKTAVTLPMIDRAAEEGIEIYADAHPYTAVSAGLRNYIPQRLHAVGLEELTRRACDPAERQVLIRAVEETLAANTGHYKSTDPPRAYVLASETHPEYNGRRVAELAKEHELSFADFLIRLLGEDRMRTQGMHVEIMSQEDVDRVFRHPRVMPCTDGGLVLPGEACHPRVRGAFPRFLGRMCIRGGLLPIETAIMKMTSLPARVYRIPGKGVVQVGMDADLIVFDPETICDNASVADCLKANSGLNYVIVGGRIAVKDGKMTDVREGKLLRFQA